MTAFTCPSNSTGSTITLRGSAVNRPEPTRHGVRRQLGDQHAPLLDRALPDEALAEMEQRGVPDLTVVGVRGQELQ